MEDNSELDHGRDAAQTAEADDEVEGVETDTVGVETDTVDAEDITDEVEGVETETVEAGNSAAEAETTDEAPSVEEVKNKVEKPLVELTLKKIRKEAQDELAKVEEIHESLGRKPNGEEKPSEEENDESLEMTCEVEDTEVGFHDRVLVDGKEQGEDLDEVTVSEAEESKVPQEQGEGLDEDTVQDISDEDVECMDMGCRVCSPSSDGLKDEPVDDDLDATIPTIRSCSTVQINKILVGAAQALVQLDDLDIVHRDIKPGNMLLKDGNLKIADYGLAEMGRKGYGYCGSPEDDEVFEELDEAPNQEERLDPLVDSDFNENLELRFREYLEFMKNLEEHQQENVDEEEEDAADYLMNDSDVEAQALMVDAVKLEHHELDHHESEHQEMERRELCSYDVLHAAKELEEPVDGDITGVYYSAMRSLSEAEKDKLAKKRQMDLGQEDRVARELRQRRKRARKESTSD